MTKDEALKLALEALDKYGFAPCDKEEDWQGFKRAITAIKEALAQPEQDWEAVAADQAMTIAMLKAEKPAQRKPLTDELGVTHELLQDLQRIP